MYRIFLVTSALFLLFACGPKEPFVVVEVEIPPGTTPPTPEFLEATVSAVIDGEVKTDTEVFSMGGETLPTSFALSFQRRNNRLPVTISIVGRANGQDVLSGQVEAEVGKDFVEILAQFCGDGQLQQKRGEVCDDGNNQDDDGCSSSCQPEALCGNGVEEAGEECDDGNGTEGDGCDTNCTFSACDNEILAPGELCQEPAGSFPVRFFPIDIIAGDFNGDGFFDLATAN